MPVEVRHFSATVPAGTTKASPQTTAVDFPTRVVEWVEVVVPPGPKGAVGFYIGGSGAQIIPWTATPPVWLVMDDAFRHWDLEGQPTAGDWDIIAYNTGNFPHTVYVTFGLGLLAVPVQPTLILPPTVLE